MQNKAPDDQPQPLKSQTYRFKVEGTRPILQFDVSSGERSEPGVAPEKLVIELHSPLSGEIFEARTPIGRLEVDRDGRVMYFCLKGEEVGFTLFVGRAISVTLSRSTGEAVIESPSKIVSLERADKVGADGVPNTSSVKIRLE